MTAGSAPSFSVGGRVELERGSSASANLLTNSDFRDGLKGWDADPHCYSVEPPPAPGGVAILKLSNPDSCSRIYPIATNVTGTVGPGTYSISGEIKTLAIDGAGGGDKGVRINLFGGGATDIVSGTHDWTAMSLRHLTIAPGQKGYFRLETYQRPSGTAWFRNLVLQAETVPTMRTFLLYPNYRGMLFDDQSQVVKMSIELAAPDASSNVLLDALDKSGKIVAHATHPATPGEFTMDLDVGAAPAGEYLLKTTLQSKAAGAGAGFTQSAYSVVKVPASTRAQFKAWYDSRNVTWFDDGKPHFVVGLYTTSGFAPWEDYWTPELKEMSAAPVNVVINYFITRAGTDSIAAYTSAMKPFGMHLLATVNNFYPDNRDYPANQPCAAGGADAIVGCYAAALSANSGVIGYYTQDEPTADALERTFNQYKVIKRADPSGVTLGVLNVPAAFAKWRDAMDVMGIDPYPIQQAGENVLSQVGDWTRQAVSAVKQSRPVWVVIQFYQASSTSHWPTRQELHDMTWMAIAEGAQGVFYWSFGAGALAWVKDPAQHRQLMDELVAVTQEVKDFEPELLSADSPVLKSNSAAGVVITREKSPAGRPRCVIAYNHRGAPVTADFELRAPAESVAEVGGEEAPALSADRRSFRATFKPYQALIFSIR